MKTVLIKTQEEAEKIVRRNPRLTWDGWDVIYQRPDKTAFNKLHGVYRDGSWYMCYRVPLTENGWEMPVDYIR